MHIFAANPLDRCERQRRDEKWLADRAKDPRSKFLPLWHLNILISEGSQPKLGWVSLDDLKQIGANAEPVFLGLLDGTAHFAIDISSLENIASQIQGSEAWKFEDARAACELLPGTDAGMVAQARSQLDWHKRHGFCAVCGHPTVPIRGGQVRKCHGCEAQHFPRTDPVVITVVADADNDRCLLGQSRGRLQRMNRYSALAGFVDQGETIEEAVAREVMEEAGIQLKNIRYHSSQPWPFPSSLMIGCLAEAATTDIHMDDEEMTDVRWFERREVLLALEEKSDKLAVPGPIAIAHHLIKAWATREQF
jgi:NAD+ diphosphatase